MSEELSELDALIESDVLEALGEKVPDAILGDEETDSITIEDLDEPQDETPQDEATELENITIEDVEDSQEGIDSDQIDDITNDNISVEDETQTESQDTSDQNIQTIDKTSLASLLSELLNNKTIEITIKVKD